MVIWRIECDETGKQKLVQGSSHPQVVECLIGKGFKRILKDNVPYQDEPLVFESKDGTIYDAMPVEFPHVENLPDFNSI